MQDSDGNRAEYSGGVVGDVPGAELTASSVSSEMQRTKGTPYHCNRVLTFVPPGCKAPPDAISIARSKLIHELTQKRAEVPKRRIGQLPAIEGANAPSTRLEICVEVKSASQLSEELAGLRPDYLYLPLEQIPQAAPELERFAEKGVTIAAVLPRVIHDRELAQMGEMLGRARAVGVTQALVGNLGHVAIVRMAGMEARGDYGLNIFNSYAVAAAGGAGLLSVTASFELKLEQIKQLSKSIDVEIIGYGRLPAHADGALHHQGQRAPLCLREQHEALGCLRACNAGAARICLPQRGLRTGEGVHGRQARRYNARGRVQDASALHQ